MSNIKSYFEKSSKNIENLYLLEKNIQKVCQEIIRCKTLKKKILVAGNGGSCSDAEHFVGEPNVLINLEKESQCLQFL